jgi:hypothetical protein
VTERETGRDSEKEIDGGERGREHIRTGTNVTSSERASMVE